MLRRAKVKDFWDMHRLDICLAILVLVVALVPRVAGLGTFLTADEKNWIGRSYEFVRAFKDFRFNDMLQTTHPGVTTLWVVGAAVTLKMWVSHIPFSFQNLFYFVKVAQFPIALLNALAVPVMYVFLRRLIGEANSPGILNFKFILPLTASLFIALDPFIIGYSRVAHVDALLMSFLFLAALATMIYVQTGYARRWLIVSSVLASLAMLTKIPAIFIVPFFWLLVLADYAGRRGELSFKPWFKERLRDFVQWLLLAAIIFVLAWPVLIFVPNPLGNALVVKRDVVEATVTPHNMTEDYTLNPWHYPAALLTRTTPVTLLFSALIIIWLVLSQFSEKDQFLSSKRRISWLLVGYVFFFVVMMTLGAKKGDRYILPVWPALDVLAATGLVAFSVMVARIVNLKFKISNFKLEQLTLVILPILVITGLGSTVYRYHPYEIAYSDPFLPDNLSQELGWGEGLDQVAAWLNVHAPDAVVASWYPEELGVFTSAQVAHINAHEQNKVGYVVLYRNMFGRAPDHYANDFIDEYYKKRDPVFVAHILGKEFAWVYEKPVYETHIGEMVPGVVVGQDVSVPYQGFAGIDLLMATFSGKATSGNIVVTMKDSLGGSVIHQWTVPVADVEDDTWLTLTAPADLAGLAGKDVFIEVSTTGTHEGDAPTLRYTREHNYRPTDMLLSHNGVLQAADTKAGDMAVRLRFMRDGQLVTEDETRLLR